MPTPLSAGQLIDGASIIEPSTLLPIQESSARRAVSASVVATLTLGLKIGGNFIIIPLALKYLGREQYGMWIILQSVATYLSMSEIGIEGIVAARPVAPSLDAMRGWLAALDQGLLRGERAVIYGILRDAVPDFGGQAA